MNFKLILFIFFLSFGIYAQWDKNPCEEFNELNTEVRDGLISGDVARNQIRELLPKIREYFFKNGGKEIIDKEWIFSLKGYTSASKGV